MTQSYTKIPKKSAIRDNFNYLMLLDQDAPFVEDPFDPESNAKLTQFKNKCKDQGRVAVNMSGKWVCIRGKLISN